MGPGKDTHGTPLPEREGCGWRTTRSTVRQTCTTKKLASLSFNNVHGSGAVLSPVQLKTGSSSEQNISSMRWTRSVTGQFVGSLWAVTRNRDKETRQATQVKSEELNDKVQNEIVQLVDDEQCPAQNPRDTSSTHCRGGTARHHSRDREKSIHRREVHRWIGRETATNHCETVPSHHEDCAEKEFVPPEK